jgi:hypothetical protein
MKMSVTDAQDYPTSCGAFLLRAVLALMPGPL